MYWIRNATTLQSPISHAPLVTTLSVHLCLQHVCPDAARHAGSPATADTCESSCYTIGLRACYRPSVQTHKPAVTPIWALSASLLHNGAWCRTFATTASSNSTAKLTHEQKRKRRWHLCLEIGLPLTQSAYLVVLLFQHDLQAVHLERHLLAHVAVLLPAGGVQLFASTQLVAPRPQLLHRVLQQKRGN